MTFDTTTFQKNLSGTLGLADTSEQKAPEATGGLGQIKDLLQPKQALPITSPTFTKTAVDSFFPTQSSPTASLSTTTPATTPGLEGRGPLSAIKDFLFKNVPITLQPAFNKPSEAVNTMGTKSMEVAYNLLNRTPEFFAGLPSKVLAVAFPGHQIPTPFGIDAGRLSGSGGEEGKKTLQTYGQDYLDEWAKADSLSGLTGDQVTNPANPRSLLHGTLSAIGNVIMPALAVGDAGNAFKEATASFLEKTGFQKTLGLKYSELSALPEDAFVNTVTKRTKSVVDGVFSDVESGKLSVEEGQGRMAQIRDEYQTLGDMYKGRIAEGSGQYTSLNKLGQAFEDISIALNENIKDIGLRDFAPVEGMARPAEESLPGYRKEPGQAPAFGLSTERVEPVGFGSDTNVGSKEEVVGTAQMGDKKINIEKGGNIDLPTAEPVSPTTQDLFGQYSKAEAEQIRKTDVKASEAVDTIKNKKEETKAGIEQMKIEKENITQSMEDTGAKGLMKYRSKVTGELPEITGKETHSSPTTGKQIKNSLFGQRGDDIVTALGFKDVDSALKAYDGYLAQRKRLTEISDTISKNVKDYRDKKQIVEAVEKKLRQEGRDRAQQIALIQDFFGLGNDEFKVITKNTPDFRLMSDDRFQGLLKEVYNKSYDAFKLAEARMQVKATIFDRELKKVDNLQQAEKLPRIENMSLGQLEEFNKLMETFKHGDEFLGVRQLQTVKLTDLADIHTKREAMEDLAKRAGVDMKELNQIKVGGLDRFLYDTALARKNPFYDILVSDTNMATVQANLRYTEIKAKVSELMNEARASRKRSLLDRLIPTDDVIFEYLEQTPEGKLQILKTMTHEELVASNYITEKYAEARDYLVQREQLKTRYWDNYITHLPAGILELWKKGIEDMSVRDAVGEVIRQFKDNEKVVNILDSKTGQILPLEKFMQFTLKREGEKASHDVARAVTSYFKVFETKSALDQIIPKLDIYVHVLTPTKMTPRGLVFDDSLKTFFKEWMNSKKGRISAGYIKQGSTAMWAIKAGIAFTRLLDLGLNIPVGIASHVGEQVATFVNLGAKEYASGITRYATSQGRSIAEQYKGFVGETLLEKLHSATESVKDKFMEGLFGLFASADRKANIVHLLGSMTPEEFQSGKISPERLAEIKLEMGKYRVTHGDASIWQKTASGQIAYQYKKWAEPLLMTTIHNFKHLGSMVLAHEEGAFKSDEFNELLRGAIVTATTLLLSFGLYDHLKNDKNKTFLETVAMKAMNDSYTMISALDPSTFTKYRMLGFLDDIATSFSTIVASIATDKRSTDGSVPGVSKLETVFTPKLAKQISAFTSAPTSSGNGSTSSKSPSLKGLSQLKSSLHRSNASLDQLKNLKSRLKIQ